MKHPLFILLCTVFVGTFSVSSFALSQKEKLISALVRDCGMNSSPRLQES